MRATELRIGNHGKEITHSKNRITKTTKQHFENIEKGEIDLFPIPLTEDWLLKFGFESNAYTDTYLLIVDHNIVFILDICKARGLSIHWKQVQIRHVHQLQNLYFALTGQELTIKQ